MTRYDDEAAEALIQSVKDRTENYARSWGWVKGRDPGDDDWYDGATGAMRISAKTGEPGWKAFEVPGLYPSEWAAIEAYGVANHLLTPEKVQCTIHPDCIWPDGHAGTSHQTTSTGGKSDKGPPVGIVWDFGSDLPPRFTLREREGLHEIVLDGNVVVASTSDPDGLFRSVLIAYRLGHDWREEGEILAAVEGIPFEGGLVDLVRMLADHWRAHRPRPGVEWGSFATRDTLGPGEAAATAAPTTDLGPHEPTDTDMASLAELTAAANAYIVANSTGPPACEPSAVECGPGQQAVAVPRNTPGPIRNVVLDSSRPGRPPNAPWCRTCGKNIAGADPCRCTPKIQRSSS